MKENKLPRSVCCNDIAWAPLDGSSHYCNKCQKPCEVALPQDEKMVVELTNGQIESLVKLIDHETSLNTASSDDAYNTYWNNLKMDLGYAVWK